MTENVDITAEVRHLPVRDHDLHPVTVAGVIIKEKDQDLEVAIIPDLGLRPIVVGRGQSLARNPDRLQNLVVEIVRDQGKTAADVLNDHQDLAHDQNPKKSKQVPPPNRQKDDPTLTREKREKINMIIKDQNLVPPKKITIPTPRNKVQVIMRRKTRRVKTSNVLLSTKKKTTVLPNPKPSWSDINRGLLVVDPRAKVPLVGVVLSIPKLLIGPKLTKTVKAVVVDEVIAISIRTKSVRKRIRNPVDIGQDPVHILQHLRKTDHENRKYFVLFFLIVLIL